MARPTKVGGSVTPDVPPRQDWPAPPAESEAAGLVTQIVLATFRLNGSLMETAQRLAEAGGITAAWWQVLGGILDQPRTLAEIGRQMGMSRQGVRRVADLLVERGLAEYRANPAHRRANLLSCTESGYWAIRQITMRQTPWADQLGSRFDLAELHRTLTVMHALADELDAQGDDLERPG